MAFCVGFSHTLNPLTKTVKFVAHVTKCEKGKGCEYFALYKASSSDGVCHKHYGADCNHRKEELPPPPSGPMSQLWLLLRIHFLSHRTKNKDITFSNSFFREMDWILKVRVRPKLKRRRKCDFVWSLEAVLLCVSVCVCCWWWKNWLC